MNRITPLLILTVTISILVVTASGSNYTAQPPPTVYESTIMSPQLMGFDAAHNMFIAHPGWINDKLVHYYKFRMYTPITYPTKIHGDTANIPISPLYLVTTSQGDFSKIVQGQNPIIRWHTADGESYSDFVQVNWVVVASSYIANTYRSYDDIVGNVSQSNIITSEIYANVPVVPTGSKLQDPTALGTNAAPIDPLMVWYRGIQVQTFVFETTSQQFADYYNPITRRATASAHESGYEISVVAFASRGIVNSIPIFHLNQYPMGVTTGVNHGGPWTGGGRNIIGFDRDKAGYTPLWRVFWVSKVPINYQADMASNPNQLTTANGFQVDATPMYVNCPNVGSVGGTSLNSKKANSFTDTVGTDSNFTLAGALVMDGGKTVTANLGPTLLATTTTNMLGAYIFNLSPSQLPTGQSTISVRDGSGNLLFDASITRGGATGPLESSLLIPGISAVVIAAIVGLGVLVYRRSNNRKQST